MIQGYPGCLPSLRHVFNEVLDAWKDAPADVFHLVGNHELYNFNRPCPLRRVCLSISACVRDTVQIVLLRHVG